MGREPVGFLYRFLTLPTSTWLHGAPQQCIHRDNSKGRERAMKVLSLICQKGGTAKTTTAINLAVEALAYGLEVVVIDLDPQVSACDWKADRYPHFSFVG